MHPRPVTIRTFDTGDAHGGRLAPAGRRERFGVRGIRAAVQHDERVTAQMRALLRAAETGPLRILLPFVTTAEELRQARALIEDLARDARRAAAVPVGAMIEVPAAALTVDHLAAHADFLSVGTNDLIQYTLAIDRTDERLAGHYEPTAPAVVRLLRTIARRAPARALRDRRLRRDGRRSGARGACSSGLGFRTFSMTPSAIPLVKRSLARLDSTLAARTARQAVGAAHRRRSPGDSRADRRRHAAGRRRTGRHFSSRRPYDECDAGREALGLRTALGQDRPLRRQAHPREQGPRAEPAVPQHQGRDDLPLVRQAALRDRDRWHSSPAAR